MKTRRLLSLALALALALCIPAAAAANPFTDVSEHSTYYDAVMWAYEAGVTTGTSATTFNPYGVCTRGQVVTFLWRAMGRPEPKSASTPFTDLTADYYKKAVAWAVEQGITHGTGATSFRPDEVCTEGQVVTFLWRTVGEPAADPAGTVAEGYAGNAFYKTAVAWGDKNGLFDENVSDLDPNSYAYRRDIVQYLYLTVKDGAPSAGKDAILSVDAATIPTPEDGHATAYIDGVKYDMLAKKAGDLSAPTMELFFDDETPNTHWCEPQILVSLGFYVNDEKGKTIGAQYPLWYWDLWKLADEEEIGVSRYGHSSYGTLKADPYDPSGQTPSVFELSMTVEDVDGGVHEIAIKAKCTVRGLVSQYDPSVGGTAPGGGFTPTISTRCSACRGSGRCTSGCKNGWVSYPTYGTDMSGRALCPICRGTGRCSKCGGSGKGN